MTSEVEWDRVGNFEVAFVRPKHSVKKTRRSPPPGFLDHDELEPDAVPQDVLDIASRLGLDHAGRFSDSIFIMGSIKSARLKAAWAAQTIWFQDCF